MIKRELQIVDVELRNLIVTQLRVGGPISLKKLIIKDNVNFESARFQTLMLCGVQWPKGQKAIQLFGMTYQYICARKLNDEEGVCSGSLDKKELLMLVERAQYNPSNYVTLEAFFQGQGDFSEADEVFIRQKRRMRRGLEGLEWLLSLWQDLTTAYGREPGRVLTWAVFFIFFGTFVFLRKDGMVLQSSEDVAPRYSAFMYSLDLIFPIVDLHAASIWAPRENRWFAQKYVLVHMIIGRILILLIGAV